MRREILVVLIAQRFWSVSPECWPGVMDWGYEDCYEYSDYIIGPTQSPNPLSSTKKVIR